MLLIKAIRIHSEFGPRRLGVKTGAEGLRSSHRGGICDPSTMSGIRFSPSLPQQALRSTLLRVPKLARDHRECRRCARFLHSTVASPVLRRLSLALPGSVDDAWWTQDDRQVIWHRPYLPFA